MQKHLATSFGFPAQQQSCFPVKQQLTLEQQQQLFGVLNPAVPTITGFNQVPSIFGQTSSTGFGVPVPSFNTSTMPVPHGLSLAASTNSIYAANSLFLGGQSLSQLTNPVSKLLSLVSSLMKGRLLHINFLHLQRISLPLKRRVDSRILFCNNL